MEEITIDDLVSFMRAETESLFGQPTTDWIYKGIEIKNNFGPAILYHIETQEVSICLSDKSLSDTMTLVFQLSHEVCHLLHPQIAVNGTISNDTLVINEGLSTYYCVKKMEDYFKYGAQTIESLKNSDPKYYTAYTLVDQLLTKDLNSIKKLRAKKPRIDTLTIEDFQSLDIEIDLEIKNKLVSIFN